MDSNSETNNQITATQVSLPKGGGAIQGIGETFQPDEFSGTAGLSIPIPTTPCRGFEPQLRVSYSSGAGNGIFGLGFALSVPNISRKTSKGLPKYDGTDTFILSNADDLVPIRIEDLDSPPSKKNYQVITYRPRTEGLFAKIEQWTDKSTGESYWRVTSRDNITSIFGKTSQARISDPEDENRVFEWLLEESFDAKGNCILYSYKPENTDGVPKAIYEANRTQTANKYIEKIQYGNDKPLQEGDDLSNILWHFEVVFDYGEYNIDQKNATPYNPFKKWASRQDPFSTYHAGFEIRTHRLCRNVLMFHRFTVELGKEPVLVRAVQFDYKEDTNITFLMSVKETGYRYEKDGYKTKSLPPLEFEYTQFQPKGHEFEPFLEEDNRFLPGLISSGYQILDLYGEGIPGVLYNDGSTTLYWEPAANGEETKVVKYNPPQQPQSLPVSYGETNNQQLIDLTGNGQLDLVLSSPNVSGYYEVKSDRTWQGFQTFPAFTNEFLDPDSQLTDITGDGLLDLLRLEGDRVKVYPGKGKDGFGPPLVRHPEYDLPLEKKGDRTEALRFADIFGTGRQHLVRIRDGSVECWPSLGYGKFGKKVTLGNAPSFGEDFDVSRLFLADIDGSGTADILYVKSDRVLVWFNQSGNSFSQAPLSIPLPGGARGGSGPWDKLDQISFADVFGNGTTCMVFSESHIQPRHWCYDFCALPLPGDSADGVKSFQRTKPHLLNQINNNLGATTRITYSTSTKYYLKNKQKGRPWITNLPFPVQVIEKVESWDAISQTKLVSSYSYHHGYYDGVEREFRGFGMVERLDAETLSSNADPYHVPPVLSKTWYHTGAWQGEESLSKQYEREYFQEDKEAYQFPDSVFDANGKKTDSETWREAHRALKGMVLRKELYALDKCGQKANLYTISQTNYRVILIKPKGKNKYGVYFVHPQESLTYDYDYDYKPKSDSPYDPRLAHKFVLEVDKYGNVLRSCAVAYGRRPNKDRKSEQESLKITYSAGSFINNETENLYLLAVPLEERSYEIKNLSLPSGQYFAFADVKKHLQGVSDSPDTPLLSWQRHYYWNPKSQKPFPFGEVGSQGLLHRSEIVEFSPKQVEDAFNGALSKADLDKLLENEGKYVFADNYWWNQGLTQSYLGKNGFYLADKTTDPFGNETTVEYDLPHYLLVKKVTDAMGNETQVEESDYQTLQPQKIRDLNDNYSEVKFDALGMVVLTSHYGTENGKDVGFAKDLHLLNLPDSFDMEEAIAHPQTYLKGAASYFYYDLFAWKNSYTPKKNSRIPVHAVNLVAENYPTDTRVQTHITYSDGFGREVQSKMRVEPGEAFKPDGSTEKDSDPRWLSSGGKLYNNKGNPVREYEPYYINTHEYVDNPKLNKFGFSSVLRYDPLQRVIRVDTPKGFFTKVEFTPWEEKHYDEDDTVIESDYYKDNYSKLPPGSAERQALDKAAKFDKTPEVKILDNLGRKVQDVRQLEDKTKLVTHYELDITGAQLSSADPRLSEKSIKNFEMTYDLRNTALKTVGVDGGTHWILHNVMGNPIYVRDSRKFVVTTTYDVLHRPTEIKVQGGDGQTPLNNVVEKIVYGEDTSISDTKKYNLRGQVYRHYDSAELVKTQAYNINGQPLVTHRQLREEYKEEANWSPTRPDRLIQTVYKTSTSYDALGRVMKETDADHNIHRPTYHISGRLAKVEVAHPEVIYPYVTNAGTTQPTTYVSSIDYNAKGQRTKIVYGNGVTTEYEYEATTFRLTRIWTKRQNKILQDLNYTYDPVGNITQVADNAWEKVFNNNTIIDAVSRYTYDALYRLIETEGMEHPALSKRIERCGKIPDRNSTLLPHVNDKQKVENYIRCYTYDVGGNLYCIAHQGKASRNLTVSDSSNRAVDSKLLLGKPPQPTAPAREIDRFFDANGNQIKMLGIPQLQWNYRDNIASVTFIKRANGKNDAEYYVYDSSGSRVRKVKERYDGNKDPQIEETIYLGGLEIRQTGRGQIVTKQHHSLRVMDDTTCIAIRNQWTYGTPPPGVKNPQVRYQLDNHLGSATMEVDDRGQIISYEEYFPYGGTSFVAGKSLAEVKLKHYRYSGKERDTSTGLYYYGARYYAPWLGRWMSCDPGGTVDGLNLYGFVGGNPVTFQDIHGLVKQEPDQALKKKMKDVCQQIREKELSTKLASWYDFNRADEIEASINDANKDLIIKRLKQLSQDKANIPTFLKSSHTWLNEKIESTFSTGIDLKIHRGSRDVFDQGKAGHGYTGIVIKQGDGEWEEESHKIILHPLLPSEKYNIRSFDGLKEWRVYQKTSQKAIDHDRGMPSHAQLVDIVKDGKKDKDKEYDQENGEVIGFTIIKGGEIQVGDEKFLMPNRYTFQSVSSNSHSFITTKFSNGQLVNLQTGGQSGYITQTWGKRIQQCLDGIQPNHQASARPGQT